MAATIVEMQPAEPLFDPTQVGRSLTAMRLPIPPQLFRGIFSGEAESLDKGLGWEVNGISPYVHDDSSRLIDWRVHEQYPDLPLQKRDRFATKTPEVYVVTDLLRASRFDSNTGYGSKLQYGLSVVAAVLKAAAADEMPTAAIATGDQNYLIQPKPERSDSRVYYTVRQLAQLCDKATNFDYLAEPSSVNTTDKMSRRSRRTNRGAERPIAKTERLDNSLASVLGRTAAVASESVVVIVSDFLDGDIEQPEWKQPLNTLLARGNAILSIQILDPVSDQLPDYAESFLYESSQPGVKTLVANIGGKYEEKLRTNYLRATARQQARVLEILRGKQRLYTAISTHDPRWATTLRGNFLALSRKVTSGQWIK